jgi:predicted DNA-binding transcriptional regulator AlpA
MQNISTSRLLRLPEVLSLVPISKSSWWAGVKCGRFPQSVKISPRCTAWKVEDIQALIDSIGKEGGHE